MTKKTYIALLIIELVLTLGVLGCLIAYTIYNYQEAIKEGHLLEAILGTVIGLMIGGAIMLIERALKKNDNKENK